MEKATILSPSLITLDMCNLESQVRVLEKAGYDKLHVDILDGHFSPSLPLGLDTVRQLRQKTDLDFDCHVMTVKPDYFIDELLDIGVQQLVFQIETADHPDHLLNKLHDAGVKAGVALKPGTPLNTLEYILDKCDVVLLMLINPGFAGSKSETQVPYAAKKVKDLKRMIEERGLETKIELDGRISRQNMEEFADIADLYVCGSTCLNRNNLEETAKDLVEFVEGLHA